jgi:hypothetical protein
LLSLGLLLPGCATVLGAAPHLPALTPQTRLREEAAARAAERDWLLTCRARQALTKDVLLAELNLGVSIHNGSVLVWGFVPSPELRQRAEKHLRALPGVTQVCSELQVLPPDDFLADVLNREPPLFPAPLVRLPEALQMPAQLTSRWADGAVLLPDQTEKSPDVLLMPPLLAPTPEVPENLTAAVEQLRNSEPRYRGLQTEVIGRRVRVSGQAARPEDVMALAQKISRLPGVERVSVETAKR